MDFTFLFIVILMLLAVKSGLTWVAAGLAILLLLTSKSKYLILAAIVGIGVVLGARFFENSDLNFWVIAGGLGLILFILARRDTEEPSAAGMGGMYPPGY